MYMIYNHENDYYNVVPRDFFSEIFDVGMLATSSIIRQMSNLFLSHKQTFILLGSNFVVSKQLKC